MKPANLGTLEALAVTIRKRQGGCQILLALELGSAALAMGLSQSDIDAAFALASMTPEQVGKREPSA